MSPVLLSLLSYHPQGLASSYDQTQAKAKASRVPSYLQATNVGKVRRIPFTDTPASGRPAPAGLGDYLQATNAGKVRRRP